MMNAARKIRLVVLFGAATFASLGIAATSAEAHGYSRGIYGFRSAPLYVQTSAYPSIYTYNVLSTPRCYPTYPYNFRTVTVPVTYFDGFGRPYVVWEKSVVTLPGGYLR